MIVDKLSSSIFALLLNKIKIDALIMVTKTQLQLAFINLKAQSSYEITKFERRKLARIYETF